MMSYVIGGMILLSIAAAAVSGRMDLVSNAAMTGCGEAVQLAISLTGTLCLWSGVMKVAQQSGLTDMLSRAFLPITGRLFPGLDRKGKAMGAITMNMAANLLGLGNAATPLGLAAMREMEQDAGYPKEATADMITFVVMNTSSLQLIPTTNAFLRLSAGSAHPMEILPACWLTSAVSVTVGVSLARLLRGRGKGRPRHGGLH